MRYLITGAGQIGRALTDHLRHHGHHVVVLRRAAAAVPGATDTVSGDCADRDLVAGAAHGTDAIFHCIHAPYDARAWARELPHREAAVMDAAARLDIPVIFPESVYAFGRAADDLIEGAPLAPCSPLGEVRARLLHARAEHSARTVSVVASDLFGPTAGDGSVATATVLRPVVTGRRVWVVANPELPHSWTYLPDLAAAMHACAREARAIALDGDAVVHAPTSATVSIREVAECAAEIANARTPVRVFEVPTGVLALAGALHPLTRALWQQRYLWQRPARVHPGRLERDHGLTATAWPDALAASVRAVLATAG